VKQKRKTIFIWLIFIIIIGTSWFFFDYIKSNKNEQPFSEFLSSMENGKIQKVIITDGKSFLGSYKTGEQFNTTGVLTDSVLIALAKAQQEHYTQYSIQSHDKSIFMSILISLLPFILIFGLLFFFMRQLQAGGNKAMSFSKSRAKIWNSHKGKVTFADVAGVDECKYELEELVDFLKFPKRFTKLGGKIPKGVILMGSPGTGKTLLARAVAGEAGVPFFSISGSDFVEMFVGVGASRVRDLFEQGKKSAPCIIFIDEIDAVGRQRGTGMGGGHDEREQTLNQLLVEMDGFESNEGIIIIAATNRPDVLDPAILRPGRFDRRIVVSLPDVAGREAIFKVHTKNIPLSIEVDLKILARSTPGMSGADIANLINESALIAAKKYKDKIDMNDLEFAHEKIIMGVERKSMIMPYIEYQQTAYHESGHALIATLLPNCDPVHKVSIIPRGRALGVTMQLPTRDRYSIGKTYLENQIAILLGGRIAEELIFNNPTSGASDDFKRATNIAKKMICEWGMSNNLGPIVYGNSGEPVFLGRDFSQGRDFSEKTAQKIDIEIKKIIDTQYKRAYKILTLNINILHLVAENLIKYETINTEELELIINNKDINRITSDKKIKILLEEKKILNNK